MQDDEERQRGVRQLGIFVTIPFVLSVPPVIGWFIGDWLDERWGTHPYLMYALVLLGMVAGFRECYRIIKRFGDES